MKKLVFVFILIPVLFSFTPTYSGKTRAIRIGATSDYLVAPKTQTFLQNPVFKPIFFESFENNFVPSGWLTISAGNANEEWSSTTTRFRTGTTSAYIRYCSAGETMDEWLITPALDLSKSPGASLVFYEDHSYWENYGKNHYIKVSTTSQSDQSSFQTLMEMNPGNHVINGFTGNPVEIDLSEFIGATIFIAFQYTGSDADNWYLDDIGVYVPDDHDVKTVDIKLESHYAPGTTIQPGATVKNVGLNPEAFPVHFGYYDWNDNPVIIGTQKVDSLEVGASVQVTFDNYAIPANIEYNFFVRTELTGDMDSGNDVVKQTINTFSNIKDLVLVEKGTGTWCGFCPGSALSIDLLAHNYQDDLAVLEYHSGDNYANEMSRHRISFYGISGFPTAIFNGTQWRVGGATATANWLPVYNDYEFIFLFSQVEPTAFLLELQFLETGLSLVAAAQITYRAESFQKSYRLFYALNESHIAESWRDLDSLQFVARAMFPDYYGKPLYQGAAAPTSGMVIADTVHFEIPDSVVRGNCELIAFIQNMNSKEIAAVAKIKVPAEIASVEEENDKIKPGQFIVQQNYPNPFNPDTWIQFQLPAKGQVEIFIYNLTGQLVRTLASSFYQEGQHKVRWNGKDNNDQEVSSGVYFVRLSFQEQIQLLKVVKMT